ncbi:hypothetical protein L3V79_02515 [Thiotrichales bacterium 19S9-12]|nr:hypothetical protein [Thiotrichales bacterium 19S9-11]MCF6811231.1 hypothetical protein [Thiotrichales bacterium 19S9-12]
MPSIRDKLRLYQDLKKIETGNFDQYSNLRSAPIGKFVRLNDSGLFAERKNNFFHINSASRHHITEDSSNVRTLQADNQPTGYKVHLSVNREDIEKAYAIVLNKLKRSSSPITQMKVAILEGMQDVVDSESKAYTEEDKFQAQRNLDMQFTFYLYEGIPPLEYVKFFQELETELKTKGVGMSSQLPSSDKPLSGYLSGRYDGSDKEYGYFSAWQYEKEYSPDQRLAAQKKNNENLVFRVISGSIHHFKLNSDERTNYLKNMKVDSDFSKVEKKQVTSGHIAKKPELSPVSPCGNMTRNQAEIRANLMPVDEGPINKPLGPITPFSHEKGTDQPLKLRMPE